MVRILLVMIAIGLVLVGAYYFGDYAGNVVITVPGYVAETNVPFLIIAMFTAFIVIGLTLKALGTLLFFRRKIDKWRGKNVSRYLNNWNVATMAGDNKALQDIERRLPRVFRSKYADSALLMRARAQLENGDYDEATSIYQGLLGAKDQRPAALKGLTDIALANGDTVAAEDYAKQAAEEHTSMIWPRVTLRDIYIAKRDRKMAAFRSEELVHLLPKNGNDRSKYNYAVAALARAQEIFNTGDRPKALTLAAKAYKTVPSSEHVTLLYATFLKDAGDIGALEHVVYETWKTAPHYNLGLLYLEAIADENERVKTKKIAALQERNPEHVITWLIRAQLYTAIGHNGNAKEALRQARELQPSKEGYLLSAENEEKHGENDRFTIDEYRKEAEAAPAVAECYVCDNCGHTHPLPQADCTVCRAFDAYAKA